MNLDTLLDSQDYEITGETKDKEIKSLIYHSDKAEAGSVFFAAAGRDTDGSLYIGDAVAKGCCAVVAEKNCPAAAGLISDEGAELGGAVLIQADDVRHAMAQMASRFYGQPSKELFVIGVTGTKGKTSTAYMIWRILENAGIKCGIIGTVFAGFEGALEEAEHTTPESVDIQRQLRDMKEAGCKAAVMEVSSQGLMQRRTDFIDFDIGVFTNMSPDHIGRGEHDSYEDYRYWKSRLFCQCRTAVMNIDDAECSFMVETFAGSCRDSAAIVFYGRDKKADFRIDNIDLWSERGSLGVKYTLSEACGLSKTCALSEAHALNKAGTLGNVPQNGLNAGHFEVFTALPGDFNAYNSAAAIAAVSLLGVPVSTALDTLRNIRIPGRAETVPVSEDFTVMVDYAHNGIALMSLLENLKKYHHNRLITVFGCGGDRDRNRRKEMAEAAAKLSDVIIVTSDNPRTEEPMKIIKDITDNIPPGKEVVVEPDRRMAIRKAVAAGQKDDIIVVAGKGHETYQIIGGEKRHFDDREEILSFGKEL